MPSPELENLVRVGSLKAEPGTQTEFDGLLRSGCIRLVDAKRSGLAIESRFDLAYNAAHALALAALRWHGYRSESRFIVFQVLPHTLRLSASIWRVPAKCHERRNLAEYEGHLETDEQLMTDLLDAADAVLKAVSKLGSLPSHA